MANNDTALQAATGAGESDSVWSGLLSTVGQLGQTVATVYNAFSGQQSPNAAPAATATPAPVGSAGSWSRFLPWIIGIGAVLVVVGLFVRRK